MNFLFILFSTIIISLVSLIGIFFLFFKNNFLEKVIYYLVAFAGGVLFGTVFFHILPETSEELSFFTLSLFLTVGFLLFFFLERILRWRHCHLPQCEIHPIGSLTLIGDSLHNFIDGVIIAAGYLTSLKTGLLFTLAVIFHETSQEIGDFALLIYSGYNKRRALLYNFLSAITAIGGGIGGYFFFEKFKSFLPFLLALAGGNFLYIASSDIIPELHREINLRKSIYSLIIFVFGVLLIIFLTKLYFHGER